MDERVELWDVIIVGGGPAGLSAALLLGRCRRRVLVFDDGRPRNLRSRAAHAVFTRDGVEPSELRRIAREQLQPYGVEVVDDTVVRADRHRSGRFELTARNGARYAARKLLLATGISDVLPPIPGLDAIYGTTAFHCPYCDGWELRDRRIAVLARGAAGVEYALGLTTWSADLVLCSNGPQRLGSAALLKLQAHAIELRTERIAELVHDDGRLTHVRFADGSELARDAVFFNTPAPQRCDLAARLGCQFTDKGAVKTGRLASTGGGLYVAGDAAREVHFVGVAAAEGLKAAFAINKALREERSAERLRAFTQAQRQVPREADARAHDET